METLLKINHISFQGKSTLNILSDICAICRENVCDKCTKCASDSSGNCSSKQCFSVLGVCNHGYHQCCIQGWTNGLSSVSQKCPMCNQRWELKKRTIHTTNLVKNIQYKKKLKRQHDESEESDESDNEIIPNINNHNVNNQNINNQNINNQNINQVQDVISDDDEDISEEEHISQN
jgi:hypothetical protein